jgi:radical SAM superfamily enzyme YgiQ (UPF0313 family)
MMSIILVNPPSLYHMPKFGTQGKLAYFELSRRQLGAEGFWSLPGEHLGLGSIQAACATRSIDVDVVNGQALFHRSTTQTWDAIRASARRNGPPVLVGFTGPCQVFEENLELAGQVKHAWPDCATVLGHDFATLNHERILSQHLEFDLVCLGEAEESFPGLADAILNGRDPGVIPGIASRGRKPIPASILDIDQMPWPTRGDLAAILSAGLSAAVFTARGCPYQCTFCTTGQTAARLPGPDRHRLKSLDNVLAEIERICTDYDVRHLTITDDLFLTRNPASRERAEQFARRLITARLGISFMIDCRVDSIDKDVFRLLRAAGLCRVFVGVETSNPQQLEFYNKRYTRSADRGDYIRSQLTIARDLGIDVIPGIITYHAESTVPELRDTLDLIDGCDIDSAFFFLNRLIAYPGTPVYRHYLDHGLLTTDWPRPAWQFADPRIADIEQQMLAAEARDRPYAELRALFESLVSQASAEAFSPVGASGNTGPG